MSTRPTLLAVVIAAFVSSGCAGYPGYQIVNPFMVPQEEFQANIATIAVAPSVVLVDLEDMGAVTSEFDSLIETAIRETRLGVVPAPELNDILQRIMEQVGEVRNLETGALDSVKIETVYQLLLEEARSRLDVDALLLPTIDVIPLEIDGPEAKWLGASECVRRAAISFFGCGNLEWGGQLPAATLFVTILDMDGTPIFHNGGGIQLLARPEFGFGAALRATLVGYAELDLEWFPREQLFVDKEQHVAAVRMALGPLLTQP